MEQEETGDMQHLTAIMDGAHIQFSDTEQDQLTLADILWAVNKCTASVYTQKEQFGRFEETVALIRQDLQKVRERTTAAKSRISDLEDKLP